MICFPAVLRRLGFNTSLENAMPRGAANTISMVSPKGYERSAWEDRFNRPTVDLLKIPLGEVVAKRFNYLRRDLRSLEGVTESFAWRGYCWRWTIEFHTAHSDEPLAVLVPSPTDLQLAVPLDRDFVRSLPQRGLKPSIRDGIGLAQDPFDTRWGVWSVHSVGLVEDLVDLVELKLRHLARQVG
jgi:hypothetical protein